MSLRDRNMDWLRKHVWVPAAACSKVISTNQVTTVTGGASLLEISTLAYDGFELDAAGEEVSAVLLLPFDMDPSFSLKFRIHYTGKSTTAADTYTWKGFINNALSAAAVAAPATAMSPDFGASNVLSGTAYQIGRTGWGEVAADTWTRAQVEAGHLIGVLFELDASDATLASEQVYFAGFEYSFVPQFTRGSGSVRDVDAA